MRDDHVELCGGVCTHPAGPPQGHLTASRYPPTTEASAAPASPTLLRAQTHKHTHNY